MTYKVPHDLSPSNPQASFPFFLPLQLTVLKYAQQLPPQGLCAAPTSAWSKFTLDIHRLPLSPHRGWLQVNYCDCNNTSLSLSLTLYLLFMYLFIYFNHIFIVRYIYFSVAPVDRRAGASSFCYCCSLLLSHGLEQWLHMKYLLQI